LKRPGSPNLSESSGNESSRKKVKIAKSGVASRSGTPLPGRPKGIGGAMSDGEATAGEASDGGAKLKKKIKLKSGTGATGTPSGSRAGSRAGSPVPLGTVPLAVTNLCSTFANNLPQLARVSPLPRAGHPRQADLLRHKVHLRRKVRHAAVSRHQRSSRPSAPILMESPWAICFASSSAELIALV
jgi:hypothetical protein